jgi:SulP family sulfate permease
LRGLINISFRFRPRLVEHLADYRREDFARDLSAGITVGIVALPLAMAFAIASGLPPQSGIITAIIGGFLISAFGGSSVQIGGPAGAFIVVVYGIVGRYGIANLMIATICAGFLLIGLGLVRAGSWVQRIPESIVIGFTNGIAVIIGLSQVKDFFGLPIENISADFFPKISEIASRLSEWNPSALALSLTGFCIVVLWPKSYSAQQSGFGRWMSRLPGTLAALCLGTIAVITLDLEVATIGSVFGGIPQGMPALNIPEFDWEVVQYLAPAILTIAFLGAVESLLCARIADSMTQAQHDPNQELMAQGLANIASPLFGGFCATGTVARTVTNIRAGGRSPVAGMIHAVLLLAILLGMAPLAEHVPLAVLAGILMFVAWNMGDWSAFIRLKEMPRSDRMLLLSTFILTVVTDVTIAISVGVLLALILRLSSRITKGGSDSVNR